MKADRRNMKTTVMYELWADLREYGRNFGPEDGIEKIGAVLGESSWEDRPEWNGGGFIGTPKAINKWTAFLCNGSARVFDTEAEAHAEIVKYAERTTMSASQLRIDLATANERVRVLEHALREAVGALSALGIALPDEKMLLAHSAGGDDVSISNDAAKTYLLEQIAVWESKYTIANERVRALEHWLRRTLDALLKEPGEGVTRCIDAGEIRRLLAQGDVREAVQ